MIKLIGLNIRKLCKYVPAKALQSVFTNKSTRRQRLKWECLYTPVGCHTLEWRAIGTMSRTSTKTPKLFATGKIWREFSGDRWIPLSIFKGPVTQKIWRHHEAKVPGVSKARLKYWFSYCEHLQLSCKPYVKLRNVIKAAAWWVAMQGTQSMNLMRPTKWSYFQ